MKLLRRTVRNLIMEAIRADELKQLALYRGRYRNDYVIYLLFHPSLLGEILFDEKSISEIAYSPQIYGMIRAYTAYAEKEPTECSGAWELDRAAAKKGWGPTMYDIALGDSPNGVMSDRMSVSDKASPVWDFYYNKRPDVKKNPLDLFGRNWTSQTEDDCDWGGSSRNYAQSSGWAYTTSADKYDSPADDKQINYQDFLSDPKNWVYSKKGRIRNRAAAVKKFKMINSLYRSQSPEPDSNIWNRIAMAFFQRKYTIDDDGV